MALEGFEPFMRSGSGSQCFSVGLESAIATEVGPGGGLASYPAFDTFKLSQLGFVVADELARVIAINENSFSYHDEAANIYVPQWVRRGNQAFMGSPNHEFAGHVYDPEQEKIDFIQEEAIDMANSCISNSVAAVKDTNIIARSILHSLSEVNYSTSPVEVLRRSTAIVARIATLNDTSYVKSKQDFYNLVGLTDGDAGVIDASNLVYDDDKGAVDLSSDSRLTAREFAVAGGGCPALRIKVMWRGESRTMLSAFWDGAVDVIESKAAESR
jgi:hypothetical protein